MRRHMVVDGNAKCHTHAHVPGSVINENKHHFQDFRYFISHTLLIYPSDFNYFHYVRLFSYVFMRR